MTEEATKKCGTCAWPTGNICLNYDEAEGKATAIGSLSPACSNHLEDTLNPAYKEALQPVDEAQDVITWDQYLEDVHRTTKHLGLTIDQYRQWAAMGLASEGGEVVGELQKHYYQGHPWNKEKLIEEMGDGLFFLAVLMEYVGTTLEEVLAYNVQKRLERFPNGFSAADSVNRKK